MEETSLYTQAEQQLTEYLRSRGMRNTTERSTILVYICSLDRHFTADDIIKGLCETEHISAPTVYNNLSLFCDAHIIRFLPQRQKQKAEYELSLGDKNVLRFICTKCGREVEFKNKAIERLLADRNFPNFNADNFTLTVYGNCKTCRRKKK